MLFFASAPRAVFALAVSLGLALAGLPALAQDAPPHEGEGQRRPAPVAKATAAKAAPAKAAPAVAKKAAPAKPGANASARPAAKPGAKVGAKADTKPPLRSLDKNHDGRVTKDEFLAGSKKRFAKADANKDGVISPQEGKAAKAALKEKQAKREAKRLAEGKPVKRGKPAKAAKPYLSTLDANKDGRVSQKEYLARREKQFSKMDANRDGSVSRDEARQAKAQAKALREQKKAQAKERRLRKIAEAKAKAGMSSPGPELVGTATPPPPPMTMPPATTPAPEPSPAMDLPLTPIAPSVPAQAAPET